MDEPSTWNAFSSTELSLLLCRYNLISRLRPSKCPLSMVHKRLLFKFNSVRLTSGRKACNSTVASWFELKHSSLRLLRPSKYCALIVFNWLASRSSRLSLVKFLNAPFSTDVSEFSCTYSLINALRFTNSRASSGPTSWLQLSHSSLRHVKSWNANASTVRIWLFDSESLTSFVKPANNLSSIDVSLFEASDSFLRLLNDSNVFESIDVNRLPFSHSSVRFVYELSDSCSSELNFLLFSQSFCSDFCLSPAAADSCIFFSFCLLCCIYTVYVLLYLFFIISYCLISSFNIIIISTTKIIICLFILRIHSTALNLTLKLDYVFVIIFEKLSHNTYTHSTQKTKRINFKIWHASRAS